MILLLTSLGFLVDVARLDATHSSGRIGLIRVRRCSLRVKGRRRGQVMDLLFGRRACAAVTDCRINPVTRRLTHRILLY